MLKKYIRFHEVLAIIILLNIFLVSCGGTTGDDSDDGQTDSEPAYYQEPDPAKILFDADGSVYPINELIIDLTENGTRNDAEAIAASVNGMIVGFVPSTNTFQLELQSTSREDLDALIDQLEEQPKIEGILKNFFFKLFSVNSSIINPMIYTMNSTTPYDKIKIQKAYDLINNIRPPLHAVDIGMLDTGIDKQHPRFDGVDIIGPNDTVGHGTEVAGVIGANNLGIVSGIPGIDYSLRVGGSGSIIHKIAPSSVMSAAVNIDDLASSGVQIVNISIGTHYCEGTFLGCIPSAYSLAANYLFSSSIKNHSNIVFVIAAGNEGVDINNTLPANMEEQNVITVAATDLDDKRAIYMTGESSNFGEGVDIAAPGVDVYTTTIFTEPLSDNDYFLFNGTSASAPMVTGVVTLLLAIDDTLTPQEIKDIIYDTGDSIITDKPISGRRLNAFRAVEKVLSELPPEPTPTPATPPPSPFPPPSPSPQPSGEICDDDIDNDKDGHIDCWDMTDCSSSPTCQEICDDEIDNDKDGHIDCWDMTDCSSSPSCQEICDDEIDNDKDGHIDCWDMTDCSSNPTCQEICDDGLDNDKDGKIDCLDGDCSLSPACNEICDDGIDNDKDGKIDCADRVDCSLNPACNEVCNDGIDNNFDGRIDCADPSCFFDPAC